MRHLLVTILLLVVASAGCQPTAAPPKRTAPLAPSGPVVKVKVTSAGEIIADGEPISVVEPAVKFAELKQAAGEVWYHRENPDGEPHANAMAVMELIGANKLTVKFSRKADFSENVNDVRLNPPDAPSRDDKP